MIKEVIVVEGINDTKRLKQFFDVDTIETHGMGLSDKTIEFIKFPINVTINTITGCNKPAEAIFPVVKIRVIKIGIKQFIKDTKF